MTFPAYFFNIVPGPDDRPHVRIYKKASESEGLKPLAEDAPIDRQNIAKLIRGLAEFL